MPRRPRPSDLLDLAFVSDPQLSPDGRSGAAVVTRIVRDRDDAPPRYRGRVHVYDLARGTGRAFTASPFGDARPRFSPRSRRLAFLGQEREEDKRQLKVMDLAGGESEALTDLAAGVQEFVWHPDERRVAFVSRGTWTDAAGERGTPRRISRLHYRADGAGFLPDLEAQIYLVGLRGGAPRKLTNLPLSPRGLAFSPDGERLYFVAPADLAEEEAMRASLWALELRSREVSRVCAPQLGMGTPVPSPDGRRLAFLAPADPDDLGSPTGAWAVDAADGTPRLLSGGEDAAHSVGGDSRSGAYPQDPVWDGDDAVLVNLNRRGSAGLARLDLDGTLVPLQDGRRVVTAFAAVGGRALMTVESPTEPGELVLREANGAERRIGDANGALLGQLRLRPASDPRVARASDGTELEYWTLQPSRPRRDHALVLEVHGGPHTNYGYGFEFEFQLLAANGYTVVYGNPRGGTGYGSDFVRAVLRDYGGGDAGDVLAIAEDALAAHVDPQAPIHLTGGSYGGFMTNWLVTHSDRFRSAVTQRSICNWLSFYGTSDIGSRFTEREQGGNPWEHTEELWRQSPLRYVADVSTPLLIVHSEQDLRCPIEQAEQLFTALKRLGRSEVEMLRVPGESHDLSRSGRPDRRIARLEAIVDWFQRHP